MFRGAVFQHALECSRMVASCANKTQRIFESWLCGHLAVGEVGAPNTCGHCPREVATRSDWAIGSMESQSTFPPSFPEVLTSEGISAGYCRWGPLDVLQLSQGVAAGGEDRARSRLGLAVERGGVCLGHLRQCQALIAGLSEVSSAACHTDITNCLLMIIRG